MKDTPVSRVLVARLFDRLAASPRGRTFILKFLVAAEEADEVGVFDYLLARVDDQGLRDLVRRHHDDELRHAQVFRACLERQPIPAAAVPDPPSILDYLDRELGGLATSFVRDGRTVMEAYALLQVLEERGAAQYPLMANALEPYDSVSANTIREVAKDEARHIKYAKAIGKRYAPDEATLAATLERFRVAEARAFERHGQAFLRQAIHGDLLAVGRLERTAWRLMLAANDRFNVGKETLVAAAE